MRRTLLRGTIFVLIIVAIAALLDLGVTAGLKRSDLKNYVVWNDIISGKARSDIVILGSSRAKTTLSPVTISRQTGMSVYNLGILGYHLDMELARWNLYLKYNPKPKVVVLALDTFSFTPSDSMLDNDQFLPYLEDGTVWRAVEPYHQFHWYDRYVPLVRYRGRLELVATGLAEELRLQHYADFEENGFTPYNRPWDVSFNNWVLRHMVGQVYEVSPALVQQLDEFLSKATAAGIKVVMTYPPEYYRLRDIIANRAQIFTIFRQFAAKYHVTFLNYLDDSLGRDTRYMYDWFHLNRDGAMIFSREFARDLGAALQPS